MLNPTWLKTFKILVEVNHFTRTAEALFMTQPGVTQHIQKLEQACGTPLLIKKGKSFELTEQGHIVYKYACDLMEQQQNLLNTLQTDDPYSGSIKLACSGALAQWLFPKFIALQAKHQNLKIKFEAAPNKRICEYVQQGHSLFGLVTQVPNQAEFEVTRIGTESLCLVLPKKHSKTSLNDEVLKQLGLVDHPDGQQYLAKYLEECGNKELADISIRELKRITYINQLSQILYPVAQGIGFTVLPLSAVLSSPFYPELYIHEPNTNVEDELYLISKKDRPLPSRYHQFVALIQDSINESKST
ncbi:LysR family transcriptional regulator [Vibrio breoganii]|uniref:LysR family transcriptional regulator n=1 Tax=Vibrio breoganii TaxID=553239 RepID=UPI000C817B8B|nr:LysR family transcriptional regulator [Vibrio breoganii]PMM20378.1 LysR family transcriptional regulator [Vibrio breoganii]